MLESPFQDRSVCEYTVPSKIISNTSFKWRVSVEEQRAQTYNRFSRGRQIAFMISDHFQATGAHDAAPGLSDLFNICLQNDDVQDFDTRWDPILQGTGEIPQELGRATSKPGMTELRRECWSRVIKEEMSALREKWKNAFSGKQLDNVRNWTLVVLTTGPILDKEHNPHLLLERRPRLTEESLTHMAVQEE